jgi:CheY-like chemotaxis protein
MNAQPHILVADDDPHVLMLFTSLLTDGGYAVTGVTSGKAAVKVLREQSVDLLVLDLNMPRIDGFDILKQFRKRRPGLRILVVSGYMQGAFLKVSELLGATASLDKADAPKKLLETVNLLLQ